MPTHPYQDLVSDVAACRNEEQVIDILYKKRNLVDGMFLSLFMDPSQNDFAIRKIKPGERFDGVTRLVQEQYVRNMVDQYLNTPEQHVPAFVRPVIRVLVLEFSFNYFASLLVYFKNDQEKSDYISYRFHMLIGKAVDYLRSINDQHIITEVIYSGPSFFTNPLATELLNNMRKNDDPFKYKSIHLVQLIAEYEDRFPYEQIVDKNLVEVLNRFYGAGGEDEKIALLQKALSIGKKEPPEVIAYLQFLLGSTFMDRPGGSMYVNLQMAMECFKNALRVYTKEKYLFRWSSVQNGMGRVYAFLQQGVASDNIEKAIEYFNNALKGFTIEVTPYYWAIQQNNLGAAYLERVIGNKKDNIQTAIEYFQRALTVQTPEFTPQDWAMTMMNLGDAYNNKYGADRPVAAQKAISFYEQALIIYTKEANPIMWAKVKTKIGDAWHTMAAESRAANLEKAIAHISDAVTVLNPSLAPQEWCISQSTLAKVYVDRVEGERVENIEKGIALYQSVLPVNTREKAPYSWAINQLNVAHCYRARLRGTAQENQQLAIGHLQQALEVLNQKQFPGDWASVQHLLGIMYYERLSDNKPEDYENALQCFQLALQVRTPANVLNSWIESMNSLGNTYRKRVNGDPSQNLEKAIECFSEVIKKIDQADNPMLWAVVQYNAGLTYRDRLAGNRDENYKKAIGLFKNALTVHTPAVNPIECFKVAVNLGKLYFETGDYTAARSTLELCHQSIENMRAQSARELSRRQLAAESGTMYETLVASCLKTSDIEHAFYYASAAKARLFTDKLGGEAQKPLKVIAANPAFADAWIAISQLRHEIDQLTSQREYQYAIASSNGGRGKNLAEILAGKRAVLATALEEVFYNFPQLSLNDDAPVARPDAVKQLGSTPLVEYFKSRDGWGAFVVFGNKIVHVDLPGVSKEMIESIAITLFEYEQGVLSGKAAEEFINQLSVGLSNLYDHFLRPLESYLPAEGSLVLAPSQHLHLLPFAIAYDNTRNQYLVDRYTISYMPSLSALENLRRSMEMNGRGTKDLTLLSVAYSAQDLRYALKEAQQIATHFLPRPQSVHLHEQAATPANVLEACDQHQFHTLHFSCHGQFNVNDPANSGLLLKGGLFTAERISTELRLGFFPMIILSACQSGISQSQDGDEAIGLIQSFFGAGAGCVISGQWSVQDRATQALFGHFCENLKSMNVAEALRQAMFSIRRKEEWNYPIYWAAFKVTGLTV